MWFRMSFMIGCDESYSYDFVCLLETECHYAAKTNLEATVSHRLDLNSSLKSILSQLPSVLCVYYGVHHHGWLTIGMLIDIALPL